MTHSTVAGGKKRFGGCEGRRVTGEEKRELSGLLETSAFLLFTVVASRHMTCDSNCG